MSCATGKREFASKRAAKRGLRSLDNPHGQTHPYRCEECHAWHIGHAPAIPTSVWDPHWTPPVKRPRDVYSGFILMGTHQVVFGNVCLTCPSGPHAADPSKPALSDLDLPSGLLHEVWETGDQRIVDTLLAATPDQLDAIKRAWTAQKRG